MENYENLKPILEEFKLDKECKVLVLGCGNAEFSEDMYDEGYNFIYNIDISENVIKSMKDRNTQRNKMLCILSYLKSDEVMDVRDIKYPDNFFDIAVDKSTIDALLCGDNSFLNVAIMTKEVQRVLKSGGIYMVISYGIPENRVFHFEREHLALDIKIYTIKKDYLDLDENTEKVSIFIYIRCIMFTCAKRNLKQIKSHKKSFLM